MAKKKKDKKEVKREEKPTKRQEKQLKLVVVFMIFLIASIFLFYWLSVKMNQFEYAGLKFEKTKQGSITFYQTKFPFKDMFGNIVGYLPVYFREDPRKLSNITVDAKINLKKNVALAIDSETVKCEDSILAATTLSLFLGQAGVNSFGATTNETEAKMLNRTYVECMETSNYSVIIFDNSLVNRIDKSLFSDCYTLSVANCEIMNVTERFMLALYAQSQGKELK